MNKLPAETIADISSHLTLAAKLNFACAAKKLYKAISENTLYSKLAFKNKPKLEEAIDICGQQSIDHQVCHLCLRGISYDTQLVSRITSAFKCLQFLEIQDGDADSIQHFKATNNWKSVESIIDSVSGNVTLKLLERLTFDHLRRLGLSFIKATKYMTLKIQQKH